MIDIRRRDLELFTQIIVFSCLRTKESSNDSPASSSSLKPLDLIRLHFLRLLLTLYGLYTDGRVAIIIPSREKKGVLTYSSDSKIFETFSSILSPHWFLLVFERRSRDSASTSLMLKLLGMFLERDELFYNVFVEMDGFKVLEISFSDDPLPLCCVLPLLAMSFQIPMKYMPFPGSVDSGAKIARFLDLEEALGPRCTMR